MSVIPEKYTHERNYGCRLREYVYRGLKTVTLENELIKVSILADKGSDIFEFLYKPQDIDFMWHSFNGVRNPAAAIPTIPNPGGAFLDFYEGGWQELFPNISEPCNYRGAPLGIHGEVALPPWEYRVETDTPAEIAVRFWIRTLRTPFLLEKTLRLKRYEPTLYIEEKVVNEGCSELQFMWGHHPAFGPLFLSEHCRIELPPQIKGRTVQADLGVNAVLPRDTEFVWPYVQGLAGKKWDVSRVPSPDSQIMMEFYLYDIPQGWYSLVNDALKLGFQLKWDRDMFPVIWIWAPYGGAEGYPWYGRNYNLAIEPWTAVPGNLSRVAEAGRGVRIQPGQTITTRLEAAAFELKA